MIRSIKEVYKWMVNKNISREIKHPGGIGGIKMFKVLTQLYAFVKTHRTVHQNKLILLYVN